jgi:hypothetical protein
VSISRILPVPATENRPLLNDGRSRENVAVSRSRLSHVLPPAPAACGGVDGRIVKRRASELPGGTDEPVSARYVDGAVEALGLENVTLVLLRGHYVGISRLARDRSLVSFGRKRLLADTATTSLKCGEYPGGRQRGVTAMDRTTCRGGSRRAEFRAVPTLGSSIADLLIGYLSLIDVAGSGKRRGALAARR